MAGIGFELRKLVEKRSVSGFLGASLAGVFIVAGPWLISTASVAAVQRLPSLAGGPDALAFTGAMVWAFALSIGLGTGPLYAYSRLVADLIYERKRGEAGTALAKSAAAFGLASLAAGAALSLLLIRDCPHAALFRASFAALLGALGALWLAMMTVTVLRRFGRILAAYAAGMGLLVLLAATWGPRYGAAGGIAALAAGYGLTATLLIVAALRALGTSPFPRLRLAYLSYARRYRNLVLAGAAYAAGTWADKAILWALRGEASPGTAFYLFPPYDLAFFYANLSLIPGLVFFTLATETDFHLDLMRFLVFLSRRRQPEVEAARHRLAWNARRSLGAQFFFQAGVALLILLLAAPLAGLVGVETGTFALLTLAGVFQLSLLAALNMLFYMELYRDSAWVGAAFLILNLGLSLAAGLGAPLPEGLAFLLSCALASAFALALVQRGLGRLDRIIYLRASGEEFGR
ncbi:MAG TPA: exopolysaccharide Pel transporter PelG [Spirochaetia bacterium]|nr:exopolysaccharide Pel transporter PelG [Spirochaetia bacterium]HRZ66061.1 exopolysaccharide Pel transporter PelG [Spirochaetia bacterium]